MTFLHCFETCLNRVRKLHFNTTPTNVLSHVVFYVSVVTYYNICSMFDKFCLTRFSCSGLKEEKLVYFSHDLISNTSYEQVCKWCHFNLLMVHPNANCWNKVWFITNPNNCVMNYCHGWLTFWMKNHLTSDGTQVLGIHILVLVPLQGRFTLSMSKKNRKWWHYIH